MITVQDIHRARDRIAQLVRKTPIMHSETISKEAGNELFFKCEHLQKTGAFKIRGAANKLMVEAEKDVRKVVTASSGNHGQAVAYVAGKLGMEAVIVVPENASACKIDAIKAYNGTLEFCGITSEERINRAMAICKESRARFIPPYDDPFVMAGQGTAGLELLETLTDFDEVYVPVGGGGLISGVATAIKESNPDIKVIGAEPAIADDTYLSLQKGHRMQIKGSSTIADGLRTSIPGELTFPVVRKYVDRIDLVDEKQIKAAFTKVLMRKKQLIEPSAAVAVAAALAQEPEGKKLAVLMSGGNVDPGSIPNLLFPSS